MSWHDILCRKVGFVVGLMKDADIKHLESVVPGVKLLFELNKLSQKKKAPRKAIEEICNKFGKDPQNYFSLGGCPRIADGQRRSHA